MQKVSAAYQRQGKTEECYRTCQSCLMDKKSVNFDEGDPPMGNKTAGEPVRLTAAAISDAHANSVRKMSQVIPSNGKGPPKAPKPSPPPKPARPALQTFPQLSTSVQPSSPQPCLKTASPIQRPPRLDLKSNALDEKSVMMPLPQVPIHATAKSDTMDENVKQAGVEYSRSPQQSYNMAKGTDTSEGTDERKQSYDRLPRSEGNSTTNCGKKPFSPSPASCHNDSQQLHKKKSGPTDTLKNIESSTKFPPESSENKNAGKVQSNLSGTSSTHVPIASQLFREKVEAMNKKTSAPTPIPIPVSHPKKLPVQDVPLPYTPECNIVFGIPDEVKAFTKENPLHDTSSSQPMSVIRAGSPLKSIIPASSSHHHQQSTHITATIETSSSTSSRGGSVGGGVSTGGGVPVRADKALQLQHSSIRMPPSPSHSPKASPSPSHSLSKIMPSPNTSTVRASPIDKSSSASSLVTTPERLPSTPHASSDIKDQYTQRSKITTQSNSKVDNSVKKISSLHINDYITTQAKPPSSHLNVKTTNYTETKNDMDSGSMESVSSRTTIESKVSTSTVTYEHECDVDDDDENQDDDLSAIEKFAKNKTQQLRQKRPERFCEKDVRKKMEEDGVPPDVMFEFLKTLGTATDPDSGQIHRNIPAVKPGQIRQSSAPSLTQVPHPKEMQKETESFIPPPPMTPPQSPKGLDTSSSKYAAYDKMRAMRIPDGAVRQKMVTDGISHREIDAYFNGDGKNKVEVEVQHRVSPPPPPPPPPPHMMPPPSAAIPVGKGAGVGVGAGTGVGAGGGGGGGGKIMSTTPPPPSDGRGAVRSTPDQSPSRGSEGIIAPSGISDSARDLLIQLPAKECTAPVQTERTPINPASTVFASIRSGVKLINISTEVDFESARKPTPPLTKKPSSMHDILISALSSRRLCSNMENLKTVSSDASDNEFDPFE